MSLLAFLQIPDRREALKSLLEFNRENPGKYTCVFMRRYSMDTRTWYRDHLFKYCQQRAKGDGYSPTPFDIVARVHNTTAVEERKRFLQFMKSMYNVN